MSAGSAGFAPKRRINRWLRREQRDHRTAGIACRQEPGLSFTQDARMGRAYGKCRVMRFFDKTSRKREKHSVTRPPMKAAE